MDQHTTEQGSSWSAGAAVIAAAGASLCCIGPILAAGFGLTSLAALSNYGFLRPWFVGLTILLLAVAFYLAYRKPRECRSGSVCETHGTTRVQRWNRIALWIATAIAAIVLTFPEWSVLLL